MNTLSDKDTAFFMKVVFILGAIFIIFSLIHFTCKDIEEAKVCDLTIHKSFDTCLINGVAKPVEVKCESTGLFKYKCEYYLIEFEVD